MANLYLVYMIFQKLSAIVIFVTVLFGICKVAQIVYYLIRSDESHDKDIVGRWMERARKAGKVFTIAMFILIPFTILFPSGKEVLPYFILSEVDQYNDANKDSKLNPQNTIQLIDNTVKGVENIVSNLNKIVEKTVEKGNK